MGLHKDCLSIIYNSVNMDVRVCGNDVAYLLFYQALLAFRANSVNRHSVIRFKATGGFPMKHLYESSMHKKKWPVCPKSYICPFCLAFFVTEVIWEGGISWAPVIAGGAANAPDFRNHIFVIYDFIIVETHITIAIKSWYIFQMKHLCVWIYCCYDFIVC